jgi:hypothetical protein
MERVRSPVAGSALFKRLVHNRRAWIPPKITKHIYVNPVSWTPVSRGLFVVG